MAQNLPTAETVVFYLNQMRIPDTEKVRQAEAFLKNFLSSPDSVNILTQIMISHDDYCIRQMSALFLRKVIMEFWDQVNDQVREQFKSSILQYLRNEKHNLVRKAICGVISYIAHSEIQNNRSWDQIINDIRTYSSSPDPNDRVIAQLFIFALYINLDQMFSTEEICHLLCSGLQDPESYEVCSMAFKATCALLEVVVEYDDLEYYTALVSPFFVVLQKLVTNQDITLCTRGFNCLAILADSSYPFFDPLIVDIVNFTIQICGCQTLEDSVRSSACDFLTALVQSRASLLVNLNLHIPIIELCVNHISDEADPEGNDEDSLCVYFEPLLDNCAKEIPAKTVFDLVCKYACPLLSNASWEARRAGVESLMVIVEHTIDVFAYDISNICNKLRPLLFDSCRAVVKKTSYFYSEIVQFLGSMVLKKYPQILEDVNILLSQPDEFNQNCGLYILECLGQYFDDIEADSILQSLVPHLLNIFNNTADLHMKALLMSSMSSIITSVEDTFIPYTNSIVGLCMNYMQLEDPTFHTLRGRCTEVITSLLCYAPTDELQNHLPQIVNIVTKSFTNPALLDDYAFYFFSSLSYQYGDQLKETYNNILNYAIQYLRDGSEFSQIVKDGADKEFGSIATTDEQEKDGNVESSIYISVKPEVCSIKCAAMHFINNLCDNIQDLILNNSEEIFKILLSFTEHMNDKIRELSYQVLSSLISIIYRNEPHGEYIPSYPPQTPLPPLTEKYMLLINNQVIDCIINEKNRDVVSNAIILINNCVDEFGAAAMGHNLENYFSCIDSLLRKKSSCQCNVDGDENYTNDLMNNEDDTVTCDGMRFLSSIIEVCGTSDAIKSQLMGAWGLCKPYLDVNKDAFYIESAVQVGCTILEFYKDAEFVINDILNVVNYALESDNEILISNIAYFMKLLFKYYPERYAENVNDYVTVLINIVNMDSITFEGRAKDNAVSALCTIVRYVPDRVDNLVIPIILENLPLVQDTKENDNVYNTLFYLLQNNNVIVSQQLSTVVSIFCVFLQDPKNTDEDIKQQMRNYLNYIKSTPAFNDILAQVPHDLHRFL